MTADSIPRVAPAEVATWVSEQVAGRGRYLFGIAGPPGSGKSTLAERVGAELDAPVVAMDGFHLPNTVLLARGLLRVKGAPETFDALAFVDTVGAIRDATHTVSCPGFDRTIDAPVADRVRIAPDDAVVIVEGNYLLLDRDPWASLSGLFDAIAYLDVPVDLRRERLIDRHVEFGRDRIDAAEFVHRSDEANAVLVEASRTRADLVVAASA
jgi:pantothenate kinase